MRGCYVRGVDNSIEKQKARTEVSNEGSRVCTRCPFSVSDCPILCDLKAHSLVASTELFKTAFMLVDVLKPLVVNAISASTLMSAMRFVEAFYDVENSPVVDAFSKRLQPGRETQFEVSVYRDKYLCACGGALRSLVCPCTRLLTIAETRSQLTMDLGQSALSQHRDS